MTPANIQVEQWARERGLKTPFDGAVSLVYEGHYLSVGDYASRGIAVTAILKEKNPNKKALQNVTKDLRPYGKVVYDGKNNELHFYYKVGSQDLFGNTTDNAVTSFARALTNYGLFTQKNCIYCGKGDTDAGVEIRPGVVAPAHAACKLEHGIVPPARPMEPSAVPPEQAEENAVVAELTETEEAQTEKSGGLAWTVSDVAVEEPEVQHPPQQQSFEQPVPAEAVSQPVEPLPEVPATVSAEPIRRVETTRPGKQPAIKKDHKIRGLLGAFLGMILGAVPGVYLLVTDLQNFYPYLFLLVPLFSALFYRLFGGKAGVFMGLISTLFGLLGAALGYLVNGYIQSGLFGTNGIFGFFGFVKEFFTSNLFSHMYQELIMILVFAALGALLVWGVVIVASSRRKRSTAKEPLPDEGAVPVTGGQLEEPMPLPDEREIQLQPATPVQDTGQLVMQQPDAVVVRETFTVETEPSGQQAAGVPLTLEEILNDPELIPPQPPTGSAIPPTAPIPTMSGETANRNRSAEHLFEGTGDLTNNQQQPRPTSAYEELFSDILPDQQPPSQNS